MTAAEASFIAVVESLQEQQVAWTRELVSIPTVNPYSGDGSAGIETAGQDHVEDLCRQLGGDVRRVPVPPDVYARGGAIGPPDRCWDGRDNVVAEWTFGAGDGPTIILNTHMDTVGAEGMSIPPFEPTISDGVMHGRGTSDSKGNLAAGLVAVAALLRQPDGLEGRVILESVVDEECNGGGAGTLACCLAGVTGDFGICLDGAHGALINGCNGVATARVAVRGRSGHAARPGAVSAIDKGIVAKRAVDAFAAEHAERFPGCLVNVGIFRSGTLPAIVPGEAELQLNISYAVEDAVAAERETGAWNGALLRRRFEAAMAGLPALDPWFEKTPARVDWIKDSYPFLSPAADQYSQTAIRAAREIAGEELPVEPMLAWFDATHFARSLGMPALGMGSGTPGMPHSAGECARLDHLFQGARQVALALHRILSGQAARQ